MEQDPLEDPFYSQSEESDYSAVTNTIEIPKETEQQQYSINNRDETTTTVTTPTQSPMSIEDLFSLDNEDIEQNDTYTETEKNSEIFMKYIELGMEHCKDIVKPSSNHKQQPLSYYIYREILKLPSLDPCACSIDTNTKYDILKKCLTYQKDNKFFLVSTKDTTSKPTQQEEYKMLIKNAHDKGIVGKRVQKDIQYQKCPIRKRNKIDTTSRLPSEDIQLKKPISSFDVPEKTFMG